MLGEDFDLKHVKAAFIVKKKKKAGGGFRDFMKTQKLAGTVKKEDGLLELCKEK